MNGKITILKGNNQGLSMTLRSNRKVVVGRGKKCSFCLQDTKSSSNHCEINVEEGQFCIADLSSTNGTYVNGKKIEKIALKDKDEIQIGNTVLLFEIFIPKVAESYSEITQVFEEQERQEEKAESLGNYRILETIQRKDYASIYKAENRSHKNIVRLQFFSWPGAADSSKKEQMERKLHSFQSLKNPCIAPVYDIFWERDKCILVGDYIEGKTLQEIIQEKKSLSSGKAIKILLNIAATLDYLHIKGFSHGGLSINNVLIESGTRCVKLLDISLYRFLEESGLVFPAWQKEMLPYHIAESRPELQDVYAASCILCYLITGNLSFSKDMDLEKDIKEIFHKIFVQKTIPSARDFYKILLQNLEKNK
ncbi:MAG: FHA domain-containing protein [Candidatus Brocadiae bacterium]|nr:FHA domain-containing protein [Candidatus Brocadiia bacterium]